MYLSLLRLRAPLRKKTLNTCQIRTNSQVPYYIRYGTKKLATLSSIQYSLKTNNSNISTFLNNVTRKSNHGLQKFKRAPKTTVPKINNFCTQGRERKASIFVLGPRHGVLIGFGVILGSFQLNFKPFRANLEAVHGLNCLLRRNWVIVRHET